MAIIERSAAFALHESCKSDQVCGLIDPADMDRFECTAFEEDQLRLFDTVCDMSDAGHVCISNDAVRIDRYCENGNVVRTVEVSAGTDEHGAWYQSYNYIAHASGKSYFETHCSYYDPSGKLHEPAVGDQSVQPNAGNDHMIHYHVAYGGIPLQQSA